MPPRWPRGRTSRRIARSAASHSRITSHVNSTSTRVTLKPLARNARYPGFAPFSASIRLTVRMTWSASPESRLPRLAPPLVRSPAPVACRRSISAQSFGAEQAIIVPVSFSTQRKAGMSSFEPSRIPAWLAPVCDERSVSHSSRRCVPCSSHRAITGALPSRIARRRIGSPSPSISRKTIPGTSVRIWSFDRRAMRWTTRNVYVSSSFVPNTVSSTTVTADARSAATSAHQKESTWIASGAISEAAQSIAASTSRISRNPVINANGSRSAAMIGGSAAFRIAISSVATNAPRNPLTLTCGTISAATSSAIAEMIQVRIRRTGLTRGRSGAHAGRSPYRGMVVSVTEAATLASRRAQERARRRSAQAPPRAA